MRGSYIEFLMQTMKFCLQIQPVDTCIYSHFVINSSSHQIFTECLQYSRHILNTGDTVVPTTDNPCLLWEDN